MVVGVLVTVLTAVGQVQSASLGQTGFRQKPSLVQKVPLGHWSLLPQVLLQTRITSSQVQFSLSGQLGFRQKPS
jgi:hypothetical protein